MHRWAAAHSVRFTGPIARSGGVGWHILVRPTGAGNRTGLLDHVDYRGRDGYIVAPPSMHASGCRYMWERSPAQHRISAAPPVLRDLLLDHVPTVPAPAARRPVVADDAYGRRALHDELAKLRAATPNKDRNDTLNRTAFRAYQLAAAGMLREQDVTRVFYETARAIGLGDRETRATLRSAQAGGFEHPRAIPARPSRYARRRSRPAEDQHDRVR